MSSDKDKEMPDDFDAIDSLDEATFSDSELVCIDCNEGFLWTAGEQEFFRDKGLRHPPKRCRNCKKAKNDRIEAAHTAQSGKAAKIEVAVICDNCEAETTVPFYPSQGRPVLCRSCFVATKQK